MSYHNHDPQDPSIPKRTRQKAVSPPSIETSKVEGVSEPIITSEPVIVGRMTDKIVRDAVNDDPVAYFASDEDKLIFEHFFHRGIEYAAQFKSPSVVEQNSLSEDECQAKERELWWDFLYTVGSKRYLLHSEVWESTEWEKLMNILKAEGYSITRKSQPL